MTTSSDRTSTTQRAPRRWRPLLLAGAAAVLLSMVATLTTQSSAQAAASTMFTIVGRGFGHGIGMSQYGAYGYAKHGWTYRQILAHYYTGISFGRVPNSSVRILLAEGQSSVRVSAATSFRIVSGSRALTVPGGTAAVVTYASGIYKVTAGARRWSFTAPVLLVPVKSLLLLANRNQNGWSTSANVHYRGSLRVVHLTGGLSIINVVALEAYLRGVVPREMPASWPAEALKSQAVAARSYAAQRVGSSGAFDLYCTTRSQVYNGADAESTATNAAVRATVGVVPTYGGNPISTFYFSTSGGHTESIQNVWATAPIAYLKGVPDPYDDVSPYHIWPNNPIRLPATAVAAALGPSYCPAGTLQTIFVTKTGVSPRVVTAYAVGTGGSRSLTGSLLRVKLGLRDTWFTVRSLSVSPPASPRTTVAYGDSVQLVGRTFPALLSSQRVRLHRRVGSGPWSSTTVPTSGVTSGSIDLPSSLRASFSSYVVSVRPTALTTYYLSVGEALSPQTSIAVRPLVDVTPSTTTPLVGEPVTFTVSVTPTSLAGTVATLQLRNDGAWTAIASGTLDTSGAVTLTWTPLVAGDFTLRVRVPGAKGLTSATSGQVVVNAAASPSPSPSPTVP